MGVTRKQLVNGVTPEGVRVIVNEGQGGYGERFEVYIGGERVDYHSASRARDGGTTEIHTERGVIYAYRALGRPHWTKFNGELLQDAADG